MNVGRQKRRPDVTPSLRNT